ncbi:MAG: DUF4126 domain-containing protein [Candidatus Acidiferrales bacterium]
MTALLVVVCFSAGLNVYATVAMLGLLGRAEVLALPPSLHVVENWYVIAICAVLFFVEFIGDKIPIFDLLWNAMHTFVRVPVAALLTYAATAQLPEWERLAATLLGAAIALAAHGGKTAARAAVAHSPEPFSNIALSLSEDAAVLFLMWFATRHVYAAAAISLAALALIVVMIRAVVRAMCNLFGGAENALTKSA